MKRLSILVLMGAAVTWLTGATAFATDADWTDYVLIAYELLPGEEAQFNRTDGALSPFWQGYGPKRLDKVHMDPEQNNTFRPDPEGWTAGLDDASMDIYAAWGEQGLYLMFEVMDDDFVGYVLTSEVQEYHGEEGDRQAERKNDAIELRLDQYSSEELINNYDQLFPEQPDTTRQNGNSLTMAQYGYRFGGDQPDPEIEIFRRNPSYDPTSTDSVDHYANSLEYIWQRWGVDDEAPERGIEIEVVMGDGNIRYQEWRMKWNQIGMEGSYTKPEAGKQIAAIFGYSDVDEGYTTTYEDAMRWRRAESYWRNPKEKGLNAWGDIEFGPKIADAKGAPEISVLPRFMRSRALVRRASAERFSVMGRTVNKAAMHHGVLIERIAGHRNRRTVRW